MYIRVNIVLFILTLFTAGYSIAQPSMMNPASVLNPMDTINRRPTEIINPNELNDSLLLESQHKADKFYDSLQSKTSRKKFQSFLYRSLIVHRSRDTTRTGRFIDESQQFERYAGKTINNITIDRHDVFDTPRNWVQNFSNNVHYITRERTIKRDLLFSTGDRIVPEDIVKNSQLLRSRSYIYDVNVSMRLNEHDTTLVDVFIVTRDSWTIGANIKFYDDKETTFALYDANFLGTGNRLGVNTNFKWNMEEYGGNVVEFRIPNLLGTFLTSDMRLGRDFGNEYLEINLMKDFILPKDFGIGASYSNNRDTKYEMYLTDTMHYAKVKSENLDFWAGRSIYLRGINSSIYLTARYNFQKFSERPFSSATLHPAFHSHDAVLVAIGIYREKFYTATLIHGYGFKEYLGAGFKTELIGGYYWAEFGNKYYIGLKSGKGGFFKSGYLTSELTFGSYIDPITKHWERTALDLELHWFSNLFIAGRSRIRQFLTLNYTQGWNRLEGADELLYFTKQTRPRSFKHYVVGTNRLVLNTETVIFTPYHPIGFRVAIFGFGDVGILGNHASVFKNSLYSTLGFGIRLKNERLVFNTIQLRLGVAFGKGGWCNNEIFRISNEQRSTPYRFIPKKPEVVDYR